MQIHFPDLLTTFEFFHHQECLARTQLPSASDLYAPFRSPTLKNSRNQHGGVIIFRLVSDKIHFLKKPFEESITDLIKLPLTSIRLIDTNISPKVATAVGINRIRLIINFKNTVDEKNTFSALRVCPVKT